MIDHSPNAAMGHAWQSARTARAQVARVINAIDGMTQVPDAHQAVCAIRNVRRAAAMALEHLTDAAAKDQLREALADFDRAYPNVCEARNVLEHFEDYSRGVGHLQQPELQAWKRQPNEQLARRFRVGFDWIDDDPHRPRVSVGPYEIDLPKAASAASLLPFEIWAAIKVQEGDPVPREFVAALAQPVERWPIPPPPQWMLDAVAGVQGTTPDDEVPD